MILEIKKFGTHLISRPEGRDAALVVRHQFLDKDNTQSVMLDFEGVMLMTPSWLDEVVQEILKTVEKEKLTFTNAQNSSVKASIETVFAS